LVSALCLFLAYLRIWKTVREEHETAGLWDDIAGSDDMTEDVIDRVFEFPYLFAITILPFATALPQAFMVTLLLFYFSDNFYNSAMTLGVERYGRKANATGSVPSIPSWPRYLWALARAAVRSVWMTSAFRRASDRDASAGARQRLLDYLHARFRYNVFFMLVLLVALVVVTALKAGLAMAVDPAIVAAAAFLLITLLELVAEPRRNFGMFEPEPAETSTSSDA
jgi:hypothetical protein